MIMFILQRSIFRLAESARLNQGPKFAAENGTVEPVDVHVGGGVQDEQHVAEVTDNEHPVREGVEVAGHHALVGMSQCEDLVQVQQDSRKIARHESDHDAHEQQSSLVLDHPARVAILRTIRRLLTDQSMRSKKWLRGHLVRKSRYLRIYVLSLW